MIGKRETASRTANNSMAKRKPEAPARTVADLQRELAQMRAERDEALAQQAAAAEVLGVINASPGDLAPVFDAILEKAHHLCGVTYGSLELYDGTDFRAVATLGFSDAFAKLLRSGYPASEGEDTRALVSGARYSHILDSAATGLPMNQVAAELDNHRTLLCVPLRRDGRLLGMIASARKEVRSFSDKEIALLQNFAAQAVIAMENARLITETREALEYQTAISDVLKVISGSTFDLDAVMEAMVASAIRLCCADHAGVYRNLGGYYRWAGGYAPTSTYEADERDLVISPGNGTIVGRAALAGRAVQIEDAWTDPSYEDTARARHSGVRTMLGVPLMREGVAIGVFGLARKRVELFTDKQIELVTTFADQAVIAIENARLITETREALEQQTATAEVLSAINAHPGDLAPVFEAMLEKALRLSGGAFGNLLTYDGELFHVEAAVHRDGGIGEELRRRAPFRAMPGGTLSAMLDGKVVSFTPNILETPDYLAGYAEFRRMVDGGGYRSVLNVALRKDGDLLGTIGIFRTESRPFSDKEIALLQNFAAQAVIAMENARLLGELRQRTEEVAGLNRGLEARVAEQVEELGRVGSLKRFLPPQVAEMVVSQGDETILESHRREIVVVFADVRNYTVFTETAEPEEVIEFLREYHAALGPLITRFEGTLSHFFGDGVMVFFNDPVPCPDPAERAVKMAMAMREAAAGLMARWRRRGHRIGFGVGIAQGFATLGQIGFADRSDYTAIGTVTNLAARLCDAAADGQILISGRIAAAVEGAMTLEEIGDLSLKGLSQAVAVYNVVQPA